MSIIKKYFTKTTPDHVWFGSVNRTLNDIFGANKTYNMFSVYPHVWEIQEDKSAHLAAEDVGNFFRSAYLKGPLYFTKQMHETNPKILKLICREL